MTLEIGALVVHETAGVCRVEQETRLEGMQGDYYVLSPLYLKDAVFYTPKESGKIKVRPVMSRADAEALVARLPEVEPAVLAGPNERKQLFTEVLKSGDSYRLAALAKAIHQYQHNRLQTGRKIGAMESTVLKKVELLLYGELAVALEIDFDEVGPYIAKQLGE